MQSANVNINSPISLNLLTTLNYTGSIQNLSQKQVGMILSLQGSYWIIDGNRILLSGKKKRGGQLNIEKFREKFFG